MNDVLRITLLLLVAVDPLGTLVVFEAAFAEPNTVAYEGAAARRTRALVVTGAALVLLVGAVLVSDPLRDLLDISPESLEIAAGLVILVPALRLLIRGNQRDVLHEVPDPGPVGPRRTTTAVGLGRAVVPVAFPIAAGPAALLVAATYGAKEGTGTALVAAVIVGVVVLIVLLAGGALSRPRWFHLVAGRVMGALMVVLAWDLVTDGVLAV